MPSPVEALPCGSRSISSTRSPTAARAVARLIAVVVLPTPPFWLATAMMRARRAAGWRADRRQAWRGSRATCCKRRTTPRGSVRLWRRLDTFIVQDLRASVNSSSTRSPLRNRQTLSGPRNGAARSSSRASGAQARAVTTSTATRRHCLDPARHGSRRALRSTRAASRRKAAFARSPRPAGHRGTPRIASTRPGNPAPLPRSTRLRAAVGMKRQKLRGIEDMPAPEIGQGARGRPD